MQAVVLLTLWVGSLEQIPAVDRTVMQGELESICVGLEVDKPEFDVWLFRLLTR